MRYIHVYIEIISLLFVCVICYLFFRIFIGKAVSSQMIARRVEKCGDGTHYLSDDAAHKHAVWGYGDKDLCDEDLRELQQMNIEP